jgi:hypothetical protein
MEKKKRRLDPRLLLYFTSVELFSYKLEWYVPKRKVNTMA